MKIKADRAIIVLRESTVLQGGEDRLNPKVQRDHAEEYCRKSGLSVVDLVLIKESGYKADRPKFQKVVDGIKKMQGPVALVVDTIDRLKRGDSQATLDLEKLRQEGRVEIHAAWDDKVLHRNSPATDLFAWEVIVAANKLESSKKSDWVKAAIRKAISQGEYRKRAPLGYVNEGGLSIAVDPVRGPLIRRLFELYATGDYSFETLAQEMRRRGLTFRGRKDPATGEIGAEAFLSKDDVGAVLKNVTYTGWFLAHDPDSPDRRKTLGPFKAVNYEALISPKLFDKVQKIIEQSGQRPVGGPAREYGFSKMIRCGFCGSTLTGFNLAHSFKDQTSPGAKTVFYRCSCGRDAGWYRKNFGTDHSGAHVANKGRVKGQEVVSCPQQTWTEEEIENRVVATLADLKYDEKRAGLFKDRLFKSYAETAKAVDLEERRLAREDKSLKGKEVAYLDKLVSEKDSAVEKRLREQLGIYRAERDRIGRELEALRNTERVSVTEVEQALGLCKNLSEIYHSLAGKERAKFLRTVFDAVLACRGTYRAEKGKADRKLAGNYYERKDPSDWRGYLVKGGRGRKVKADQLILIPAPSFRTLIKSGVFSIAKPKGVVAKAEGGHIIKLPETEAFPIM